MPLDSITFMFGINKKILVHSFLLFQLTLVCIGKKIARLDKSKISENDLDIKNETLMKTAYVNGLAVGVFK